MKKIFKLLKSPILTNLLLISGLCIFLILIFLERDRIINKVSPNYTLIKEQSINKKFAKEILDGGYILFFRHAERYKAEPFQQLQVYDAYEVNNNLKGENTYFAKFVCLNELGKIQAKMIGQVINQLNVKFSKVISSTSCRSRQTAKLAFNRIDETYNSLVHQGPWSEPKEIFFKNVREILLKNKPQKGENIFIVAHNSVIKKPVFDEVFDNDIDYFLQEGGFYLIENRNKKLYLVHKFRTFLDFSSSLYKRPQD